MTKKEHVHVGVSHKLTFGQSPHPCTIVLNIKKKKKKKNRREPGIFSHVTEHNYIPWEWDRSKDVLYKYSICNMGRQAVIVLRHQEKGTCACTRPSPVLGTRL